MMSNSIVLRSRSQRSIVRRQKRSVSRQFGKHRDIVATMKDS